VTVTPLVEIPESRTQQRESISYDTSLIGDLESAALGGLVDTACHFRRESSRSSEHTDCFAPLELYRRAQREEGLPSIGPYGLDKVPVSFLWRRGYPQFLLKYPRSFVEKVARIRERSARKTRRFNFIGKLRYKLYPEGVRDWVVQFARSRFSENDYFQDSSKSNLTQDLGQFDHTYGLKDASAHQTATLRAPETENARVPNSPVEFDEAYLETLCQSDFTLAPAGDCPWSYRFMEAIFCGSIPIVDKKEFANSEYFRYGKKPWWHVDFHFEIADNNPSRKYVYNSSAAAENLEKAMRYHTFIHGFNDNEVDCHGPCS